MSTIRQAVRRNVLSLNKAWMSIDALERVQIMTKCQQSKDAEKSFQRTAHGATTYRERKQNVEETNTQRT